MRITVLSLATLIACGGGSAEGPKTNDPTTGGSNSKTTPGDVSFELPATPINGIVFEPEALGRAGMPLYDPKDKKIDLAKQRAIYEKTNPKDLVQKQAQAAVLATLLYREAKGKNPDEEKKLWGEARQVLRDVQQLAGKNVDDITLRLLGSYELLFEDYPAAEKAWDGVIAKSNAKDKELPYNKAWWTYSLLRQFKNAEALAVIKAEKLDPKEPELAYAIAWTKWRANDQVGAWDAIVVAAKGWDQRPLRNELEHDVLLFAGRANVPFNTVLPQLTTIFGTQQLQQYGMLAKLGAVAYGFAGRWSEGIAAIDKAIAVAGATVPVTDAPVLRYQEADFEVRLDQPSNAAQYAKQALDALPVCGTKCPLKQQQDVVDGVFGIGVLFHNLYATANDVRYYQPAFDIYQATTPLITNQAKHAQAQKYFDTLKQTLRNTKAGSGTHAAGAIGALLNSHNQEVQACYEATLIANPKLGGSLVVTLDVEQSGTVKGIATEPKAGQADLSQVAGCVAERAKVWKLPKRGMAGSTRIKLTYNLAPKKAGATPTAAPGSTPAPGATPTP